MRFQHTNNKKLPTSFYLSSDTVKTSRNLLGKILKTNINGQKCSGIITETEAYCGTADKACHAYNNKLTKRTETMFMSGGVAYIYLCYGIHHLFNVVTNSENEPHAILIRGIKVLSGADIISLRTCKPVKTGDKLNGPGKLTKALGITTKLDKEPLCNNTIWIEDIGIKLSQKEIISTKRIGVDYAKEDSLLPYRFILEEDILKSKLIKIGASL